MAEASIRVAAILLVAVPTVEVGGVSLLAMITRKIPGYLDNPVRRHLFRAGHAHAGAWIVFALVVSSTSTRPTCPTAGRPWCAWDSPSRRSSCPWVSLSILRPDSEKPHGVLRLTILGGPALAVATVTLGIGLLLT